MKLHDQIEAAWQKFRREAEEHGAQEAENEEFGSYTERDPISEQWQTKGKLIRLDDAIMALHLMAARHSFHGIASVKVKIVTSIREMIVGFLAGQAARKLIGRIIGRNAVTQLANLIAQTISDTGIQREVESSVRTASFEVRSDLYREPMKANPKRRRKTKLVYTRHPIPPQRRPNKSWRSPKR